MFRLFYQKSLLSLLLAIGGLFLMATITYAQTCFTRQQVSSDGRCLYVMNNKVYEKGSRSEPHQGHPCGTDVTSMIPVTHQMNIPTYLTPNYKGDICVAPTPTRVPTPTTRPTATPSPSPLPTITPLPTVVPPTLTPAPILSVVATPTPLPPMTNLPILTALDAASGDMTSYEAQFRISYQSLVNCYGSKITSPSCTDKVSGDINNDGAINEIDYNLILIGFNKIDHKKLFITPTPTGLLVAGSTRPLSPTPVKKPLTLKSSPSPTSRPTIMPTSIPVPVIVTPTKSPLVAQGLAVSKASAYGGILSIPAAIALGVNGALKKRKKKKKV